MDNFKMLIENTRMLVEDWEILHIEALIATANSYMEAWNRPDLHKFFCHINSTELTGIISSEYGEKIELFFDKDQTNKVKDIIDLVHK